MVEGRAMVGSSSIAERARAMLERIERLDAEVNAYVLVDGDRVMRDAERLDAVKAADRGPLHGLMFAVKDIVDVADMPTRAGSAFYHKLPREDAPIVRAMRDAGAVVLGKTNTHEFAWGITTENPHFGRTKNPWDLARIVGGSSGGSGAVLAADLADAAIGTDTLGSIRIPSACCGTSGIRPATGVLSIEGIFPLTPGLDTPGPMARDVRTVERCYGVMSGAPVPRSTGPLRVGRLRGGAWDRVALELDAALGVTAAVLRAADVTVVDVEWSAPALFDAIAIVQQESAARIHRDLIADPRNKYGDDVRERVERAIGATNLDVDAARATIAAARADFDRLTHGLDAVLGPVLPDEAPVAPAPPSFRADVMPLVAPSSAFGLPALALPIGIGAHGMPLGMQVIGTTANPSPAFAVGRRLQSATPWHERRAPLAG